MLFYLYRELEDGSTDVLYDIEFYCDNQPKIANIDGYYSIIKVTPIVNNIIDFVIDEMYNDTWNYDKFMAAEEAINALKEQIYTKHNLPTDIKTARERHKEYCLDIRDVLKVCAKDMNLKFKED